MHASFLLRFTYRTSGTLRSGLLMLNQGLKMLSSLSSCLVETKENPELKATKLARYHGMPDDNPFVQFATTHIITLHNALSFTIKTSSTDHRASSQMIERSGNLVYIMAFFKQTCTNDPSSDLSSIPSPLFPATANASA